MSQEAPEAWKADPTLVAEVDKAMSAWWQGDYVEGGVLVHIANGSSPLTPVAAAAGPENLEKVVDREVVGLVATSQTCDIQKSAADSEYVGFAQLVELPEKAASEARGRRRPRYAHVPAAGDRMFADLDTVVTVEKAVVAKWARKSGCRTDEERRRFNEAVRRKQSRFAFPDDVARSLKALRDELDRHDGKNTELGRAVAELREIRIQGIPDWSSNPLSLYVYFVLPPSYETLSYSFEDWEALILEWLGKCEPQGIVETVEGEAIRLDEMSADIYLGADQWDTDTFSD